MLTRVMQDALNEQINNELYSAYSYLAMSAYCERQQFPGCAHWLRMQSTEENAHAMRLYDFLIAREGAIRLKAIMEPPDEFESIIDVFEQSYRQEQEVTGQINALYELAFNEKAFAALVELEWFIKEQVEEERVARQLVAKFKLGQNDPATLLELDNELSRRQPAADVK